MYSLRSHYLWLHCSLLLVLSFSNFRRSVDGGGEQFVVFVVPLRLIAQQHASNLRAMQRATRVPRPLRVFICVGEPLGGMLMIAPLLCARV